MLFENHTDVEVITNLDNTFLYINGEYITSLISITVVSFIGGGN